jgi:hypothetical protein
MILFPWQGPVPTMTQSEYDRRMAEANGMADICVRVIPDQDPEAGQ